MSDASQYSKALASLAWKLALAGALIGLLIGYVLSVFDGTSSWLGWVVGILGGFGIVWLSNLFRRPVILYVGDEDNV